MMKIVRPYLLSLIFLLTILLAACNGKNDEKTIKMANMHFVQNEVEVKAGDPVTLHLVNMDGYAHAFDMDEFDIHHTFAADETLDVTFTPEKPGSYPFYCGSPGHEAAGMVGTLIVTP
jgi:plastocyanin